MCGGGQAGEQAGQGIRPAGASHLHQLLHVLPVQLGLLQLLGSLGLDPQGLQVRMWRGGFVCGWGGGTRGWARVKCSNGCLGPQGPGQPPPSSHLFLLPRNPLRQWASTHIRHQHPHSQTTIRHHQALRSTPPATPPGPAPTKHHPHPRSQHPQHTAPTLAIRPCSFLRAGRRQGSGHSTPRAPHTIHATHAPGLETHRPPITRSQNSPHQQLAPTSIMRSSSRCRTMASSRRRAAAAASSPPAPSCSRVYQYTSFPFCHLQALVWFAYTVFY